MELTFDLNGATGQRTAWVSQAVALMGFPWDVFPVNIAVSFPVEPSLPGHSEYMATFGIDTDHFAIEIRRAMDDPAYMRRNPPYDEDGSTHQVNVQTFYIESVGHELGHVIAFRALALMSPAEVDAVCSCFVRRTNGEGDVEGTAAALHPPGAQWADMLQEGMAETLKDILLPDEFREFDNRTNWKLKSDRYDQFMAAMWPSATEGWGADGETIFYTDELGHPHYEYDVGDHLNVPAGVPITYTFADHLEASADPDAKILVRWYVPPDATFVSAVVKYDLWAINTATGPGTGKSYLTGVVDSLLAYNSSPQVVLSAGDKGLVELDYPATIPPGYNAIMATSGIFGSIVRPLGEPIGHWDQVSYAIRPPVLENVPPIPYREPVINASASLRAAVRLKRRAGALA